MGTMYMEHVGVMNVVNHTTGQVAPVEFKAAGRGDKNKHAIEGYVYENRELAEKKQKADRTHQISGTWSESIFGAKMVDGEVDSST